MNVNNTPIIVVSGLGLMTGLGLNLAESWNGLVEGRSVTAPFRELDRSRLTCPYGVELPEGAEELFQARIAKRKRSQMTRATKMNIVIAEMAMEDAGLDLERLDKDRIGVVVGTTGTAYTPGHESEKMRILKNMSNSPASWISLIWKFSGPSFVVGTACSSGVYAMAQAYWLLATGQVDVVICGAADSSINQADIEGFCELLALADPAADPKTASRPFDSERSGFVIGEGGGYLILETLEHARTREAGIYARMHYPGLYTEAYNILSPAPDGRGMSVCMQTALANSGLDPVDIGYINAHGTSTGLNDLYETKAIKEVFGSHSPSIPVSSTKSMTGHCLAGSGGVEAVIACMALIRGVIPPTINLNKPDDGLDLDYVPGVCRNSELTHVMSNSFAFGGHNGVNIFSRLLEEAER